MTVRAFVLVAMCFTCACFPSICAQSISASPPPANDPEAYLPLKKCWEFAIESGGRSIVSTSNGAVYFADVEGRIRAVNLSSGKVLWATELGGTVTAMTAVSDAGLAVVTASASPSRTLPSTLRLLSLDSGLVRYSIDVEFGENLYLLSSGSRIIGADSRGTIASIDARTGTTVWRTDLAAKLTAIPSISYESLAVATQDKKIAVMALSTGKAVATIPTERVVTSIVIRENGMILAGDERGLVTNFRDSAGTVWWKFKSGAKVGTISETDGGILVGSFDNFLYMLSKYTGDVKWKRRLDGRIVSAPTVLGDYLIAASSSEENTQVLDINNGKPVDQLAFGENIFALGSTLITEKKMTIFPLVNAISAYSQLPCSPN